MFPAQFFRINTQDLFQPCAVFVDSFGFVECSANPVDALLNFEGYIRPCQTIIHPSPFLPCFDQTGLPKDGHVLGYGGWSQREQLNNLAEAKFPGLECV